MREAIEFEELKIIDLASSRLLSMHLEMHFYDVSAHLLRSNELQKVMTK